MKNIWKILIVLIVLAVVVTMFTSGKNQSNVYPLAVRVDSFNQAEDTVSFVDGAGNEWKIYGIEDWMLGDVAALLMDDNGTPEYIYDDSIILAQYGFNDYIRS